MGRHKKFTLEDLSKEQKFEIVEAYKQAKDPQEQIKICAELYDVTPLTIRKVLREAGIDDQPVEATDEVQQGERTETKGGAEIISVSSGPFFRAEAIMALIDENDPDSVKEKALSLIREVVYQEAARRMYGVDL